MFISLRPFTTVMLYGIWWQNKGHTQWQTVCQQFSYWTTSCHGNELYGFFSCSHMIEYMGYDHITIATTKRYTKHMFQCKQSCNMIRVSGGRQSLCTSRPWGLKPLNLTAQSMFRWKKKNPWLEPAAIRLTLECLQESARRSGCFLLACNISM